LSEAQNWVGFVLSKTVIDRLAVIGLPAHKRLNYAIWNVPMKRKSEPKFYTSRLPSFIIGASPSQSGNKQVLIEMRKLRSEASSHFIRKKYENTIEFLVRNAREPVQDVRR